MLTPKIPPTQYGPIQAVNDYHTKKRFIFMNAKVSFMPKGIEVNEGMLSKVLSYYEHTDLEKHEVQHTLNLITDVVAMLDTGFKNFPKDTIKVANKTYRHPHNDENGDEYTDDIPVDETDIMSIEVILELLSCRKNNLLLVDRREDYTVPTLIRELSYYNRENYRYRQKNRSDIPIFIPGYIHMCVDNYTRMKALYPSILAAAVTHAKWTIPLYTQCYTEMINTFDENCYAYGLFKEVIEKLFKDDGETQHFA
ncbi:MAG: hypothetical protein KAH18_05200 [Psychromonas sp.]|nr:hypothetical protein [Psychromonas sp.]